MFDTILHPTRTEYVTRTVHEHRAPTDESVKILREMEKAARDAVVSTLTLENNIVKGKIQFVRYPDKDVIEARLVYDFNGTRIVTSAQTSAWADVKFSAEQELLERLHENLAKELAAKILAGGWPKNLREIP